MFKAEQYKYIQESSMKYECRYAAEHDIDLLTNLDKHITPTELRNSVALNRVLLMCDGDRVIGWLRYNLFWDNTPFMNKG